MKACVLFWTLIPWRPPSTVLFSIETELESRTSKATVEDSPSITLDLTTTLLAKIEIALPSLSIKSLLSIVLRAPSSPILIPSSSLYFIVLLNIIVNIPWLKTPTSVLSLIVSAFVSILEFIFIFVKKLCYQFS